MKRRLGGHDFNILHSPTFFLFYLRFHFPVPPSSFNRFFGSRMHRTFCIRSIVPCAAHSFITTTPIAQQQPKRVHTIEPSNLGFSQFYMLLTSIIFCAGKRECDKHTTCRSQNEAQCKPKYPTHTHTHSRRTQSLERATTEENHVRKYL